MTFQPSSRTSGTCVWPQQITRASVPRDALEDDRRVERLVEALRLRAGRGVHGEDQRVVDAQPPLGRQAAQPLDLVVAELVVGPLGRVPERVGHAVGHPRERRRVVEVGDGDVGVALDDVAPVGLDLAERVDGAGRAPARS